MRFVSPTEPPQRLIERGDFIVAAVVADDLAFGDDAHVRRGLPLVPVRHVRLVGLLGSSAP